MSVGGSCLQSGQGDDEGGGHAGAEESEETTAGGEGLGSAGPSFHHSPPSERH